MSLVNQVLRDLDARREAPPLDDALEGLRSAPPATRTAHTAGVALGVAALLAVAGGMGWLYLQPQGPQGGPPERTSEPAAPAAAPVPDPEPAPGPRTALPEPDGSAAAPLATPPPTPERRTVATAAGDHRPATDGNAAVAAISAAPGQTGAGTPAPAAKASAPGKDATATAAATAPAAAMRKTPRPLSPAQRAEQAFAAGLEALQAHQWRIAEQRLRDALQADPGHRQARQSLAGLLLRQDRRREAEELLAAGLESHPQAPALARLHARLLLDRGRTDTAIRVLENALVNAVEDAEYLALLAAAYHRAQRYAEAEAGYRAALTLVSDRAAWWLGLALSLEGQGRVEPAAGAYRSALANPGLNEAARRYARQRLQRLDALLGRQ